MTSIENSLGKLRRIDERHQQQIEAFNRPTKELSRLAEKLTTTITLSPEFTASMTATRAILNQCNAIKIPDVKLSNEMTASMKATQAIVNQCNAIRIPAIKLSHEFTASMKAATALAGQCATIRMPALHQSQKIAAALALSHQRIDPIRISSIRNPTTGPIHRTFDAALLPAQPAVVRKPSPAKEAVATVNERFAHRKRLDEDRRHQVVIALALKTGKWLYVHHMEAETDELIRVVGEDSNGRRQEVLTGIASFQYQIITLDVPPVAPDLELVT